MMEEDDVKLNAINAGPATTDCMAYQRKCDTIRCRNPNEAGWGAPRADYVCESTGIFLTKENAHAIIDGSANKVVSSAPAKDNSQVVAMGVNADEYHGSENFILCASYTINGFGPSIFLTKETAQAIIDGGAKKVVSSAPAKDNSQVVDHGCQRRRLRRQLF